MHDPFRTGVQAKPVVWLGRTYYGGPLGPPLPPPSRPWDVHHAPTCSWAYVLAPSRAEALLHGAELLGAPEAECQAFPRDEW